MPQEGLIFSGVITGNLTLIKTYPDFGSVYTQKDEHGTLILTNTSNNYTGKTILRAGRLFVNANALGVNTSTSDSVVVEKFGTLLLYGGVQLNKKISDRTVNRYECLLCQQKLILGSTVTGAPKNASEVSYVL